MFDKYIKQNFGDGYTFEVEVSNMLRQLGFNANRTGNSDDGVDIVAEWPADPSIRFYIQCKCYNKRVSRAAVREVYTGTALRNKPGYPVVVTNNYVVPSAKHDADKLGIEIISRTEFEQLEQAYARKEILQRDKFNLRWFILALSIHDEKHMSACIEHLSRCDSPAPQTKKNQILETGNQEIEHKKAIYKRIDEHFSKLTQIENERIACQRQIVMDTMEVGATDIRLWEHMAGSLCAAVFGGPTMADSFDRMLKGLDGLTYEELMKLGAEISRQTSMKKVKISELQKIKDANLVTEGNQIVSCPHCGSADIKKHGTYNDKQRYRCKDCNRTFNITTNSLFHHSKLSVEQIKSLIRGMVQNLSNEAIGKEIMASPSSVWGNRIEIMNIIAKRFSQQDSLEGIVEVDEYSVRLSFRGKRDPEFFIYTLKRMPRHHYSRHEKEEYLKKHGLYDKLTDEEREYLLSDEKHWLPGTNKDSVCVLTGVDRGRNMYIAPSCVGSIEAKHVKKQLADKIDCDDILVTDGSNAYTDFAEEASIQHEQVLASVHARGAYHLAHVNAQHSRLSDMFSNGKVPATKYLDLYLLLFWWLKKYEDLSVSQQVDLIFSYILEEVNPESSHDIKKRSMQLDTKGLLPNEV